MEIVFQNNKKKINKNNLAKNKKKMNLNIFFNKVIGKILFIKILTKLRLNLIFFTDLKKKNFNEIINKKIKTVKKNIGLFKLFQIICIHYLNIFFG